MVKFKHFETESGKIIMTAQYDGYQIAERLLEGLMFQISIQPDGSLKSSVKPEDENYFSQFNTVKFLKEAEDYAYKNDIFEDPNSGEECWLVVDGVDTRTQSKAQPITVKVGKFDSVFGQSKTKASDAKSQLSSNGYAILDMIDEEEKVEEKVEEIKEIVIGKFKPKRKFLNFIQGRKGGIRYHTDVAFIKSEELTGTIEGAIFKVSICDNGTINFEEVDTNFCDDAMVQRFIDDIDSRDVTGYMSKFVVHGVEFQDTDAKNIYLEVEHKKPIDQLFSLFDEIEETKNKTEEMQEKMSETGMSILDTLFSDETDVIEKEDNEIEKEDNETKSVVETSETYAQQMMREAFEDMNAEKIQELSDRIDKKEKDITKYKMDINQAERNLKSSSDDLGVLYSRLDNLKPIAQPNGFIFYVSPINKSGVELDDNLKQVVNKISPLLKLKEDAVIDFLTGGYYTIKIAKKGNSDSVELTKEMYSMIAKLDVNGKVTLVGSSEFEYRGDFTWHKIVDKMIRLGFEQEPEFDKLCGSPSYQSEEKEDDMEVMKNSIMDMAKKLGIEDVAKNHLDSIDNGDKTHTPDELLFVVLPPFEDIPSCVAFTLKSEWVANGYQSDDLGGHNMPGKLLESCGVCEVELQESVFEVLDPFTMSEVESNLLRAGFQIDPSFTKFIKGSLV